MEDVGPDGLSTPGAVTRGRKPRLVSDGRRFAIATAVSVVLAAGYVFVVPTAVGTLSFVATIYFGSWAAYAVTYVALTWVALGRADGSDLRRWLGETRDRRRRRRRTESLVGSGGPAGAVSFCLLALGAVIGAAVAPELRGDLVVLPLAVAVVVTTWVLIVTVFALHYAREDAQLGGLHFFGIAPPDENEGTAPAARFVDYAFLAVQVSTSYTSGDVKITGRVLRRAMITQTVVAFVFNSILIALVVSLITLSAAA